jgi:hypothetical protein
MTTKLFLALLMLFGASAAHADVRCARLSDGDAVMEYRVFSDMVAKLGGWEPGTCPPDIPHKNVRWLPAPQAEAPAYDPATQVLEGPTVSIGKEAVTESYAVRDKTAEELDADKDAKLGTVDVFVLKVLCDHESRVRALEGKSEITLEQCRAAIKAKLQ